MFQTYTTAEHIIQHLFRSTPVEHAYCLLLLQAIFRAANALQVVLVPSSCFAMYRSLTVAFFSSKSGSLPASPEGRSWRNQSCICKLLVNSDYRIELTSMLKWLKLGLGRNWADWLYLSEDNISQRKFPSLSGCAATLNVTVDAVKGTRSLFANGVRSDFSDVQIAGQVVNKVAMRKFFATSSPLQPFSPQNVEPQVSNRKASDEQDAVCE